VCIIDPPRGIIAIIPALMAIGLIELVLILLLRVVLREGLHHGIPMGRLILDVIPLLLLIGALIWQMKILWRSCQLPKMVEVADGFLRVTNDQDLFGRNRWRVEKVRRAFAVPLGMGFWVGRRMGVMYEVGIGFRGFRFQRRVFKYLSRAEAIWAANVLNRAMGLREIRVRRRRWFSLD
jgi:hypothetical protein